MEKRIINNRLIQASGLIIALAFFLRFPVHAGVIEPSGNAYGDYYNMISELRKDKSVTLQSGKTYYLSSMIKPENGWEINASGAKIICDRDIISNEITKTNYNSLNGFTINGGNWTTKIKGGIRHSFIKFTHARNIKLINMTINACNYESHSVELVACKNVEISGCKIKGKGTPLKKSVEEAVQIDVATPTTAPYITNKKKFCNGAGCKNITVQNCTITGSRAVCVNFLNTTVSKYRKYKKAKNYHSDIVIKNNSLTGLRSEGVCIYNTLNAIVSNNKIVSKSKRVNEAYSVGCHFALFYPAKKSMISKSKITVSDNIIYGGRQALNFDSHSSAGYGKVTVKNNKLYCKKGKDKALHTRKVKTLKNKGNKLKKWKA